MITELILNSRTPGKNRTPEGHDMTLCQHREKKLYPFMLSYSCVAFWKGWFNRSPYHRKSEWRVTWGATERKLNAAHTTEVECGRWSYTISVVLKSSSWRVFIGWSANQIQQWPSFIVFTCLSVFKLPTLMISSHFNFCI